ncbi:MAG: sensor domain-containing diguanylate cyclase, partial [Candidatus Brocadiales bacterium]
MKNEHKIEAISWWWYLIISVIGIIIVGITAYSLHKSVRMNAVYAPLIDAAMEIKLEATTAHLWFEEIISGDRYEEMETVWKHLEQADWYAQAMLEGGKNPEGTFIPLDDAEMRQNILDVRTKLSEFYDITKQRLAAKDISGAGTDIDQRYDAVFEEFITLADVVETRLQQVMAHDLYRFKFTQTTLIVIITLLSLFAGILIYSFMRTRSKVIITIQRAVEEKDSNINKLNGLMEFSIRLKDAIREKELINHATHVLRERFNPDVVAVLMLNSKRNLLEVSSILPPQQAVNLFVPEVSMEPTLCYTIRTGKDFVAEDIKVDLTCDCLQYKMDEGGYVCIPLTAGGTTIGMVLMIKKEKGFWDSDKRSLFSAYVGLMATAIHGVRLMEATRHSAVTDSLTGLYNRRFFDEMLGKQMALADRHDESLSLLIIDLDCFKDFNDTYGHITGDRVLQGMASIMKNPMRASDVLTRFGGEEFAVIMPTTEITNAVKKAESIRQHVESNNFDNIVAGKTFKMTVSIGVASFPEHGTE